MARKVRTTDQRPAFVKALEELEISDLQELFLLPHQPSTPFEELAGKEECEYLLTVVATLKERERRAIHMLFVQGMTPDQVARATGQTANNVRDARNCALRNMRHPVRCRLHLDL